MIYRKLFDGDTSVSVVTDGKSGCDHLIHTSSTGKWKVYFLAKNKRNEKRTSILRTSKAIYEEARPVLYRNLRVLIVANTKRRVYTGLAGRIDRAFLNKRPKIPKASVALEQIKSLHVKVAVDRFRSWKDG